MKLPRVSFWQLSAYAAFLLAVLILLFLPQEWQEIKDATLSAGKQILWSALTWLLDGAPRAWLILFGIALGIFCLCGYASLQRRIKDIYCTRPKMRFFSGQLH